jgi:hypothetical protein
MATSGAIARQPINRNFLSQLNYKFILHRAPNIEFWIQRVNLPGMNIGPTEHPNPFVSIPYSGEQIDYEPLGIDYKVDEDFANWFEINNWLTGLGFPENFDQYKDLKDQKEISLGEGLKSDISLMIQNSSKKPNMEFIFHDAFPISLSSLPFDVTDPDVDYLEATAVFKYTYMTYNELPA